MKMKLGRGVGENVAYNFQGSPQDLFKHRGKVIGGGGRG